MRDVGAELGGSGSGDKTDSEAATRRRKMTIQLREARRSLSEPDAIPTHSTAMVRLFAQINRSATPMLGIIALGVCAMALAFIDAGPLTTWITFISCAIAIGYSLPIAFLDSTDKEKTAGAWRRKFVFSTALSGSAWAYLIVTLLEKHDPNAHAFAIIVMLLVSTVMSLLAAAIPAAFVAGMLPMIVGVILLYAPRLHGAAVPTAALAIGVIGYFLIVARRLHATASDNISFQAEKDFAHRRTRTGEAQFGRGAAPRRGREPRQVSLSRDHEPRTAHAAQRDPWILGGDERRIVRPPFAAGL